MAKITIKVDPSSGICYIPKSIRREGFTGEIELLHNALTVTMIKPGTELSDVGKSLGILLQDIALRRQQEGDMDPKTKNKRKVRRAPTNQEESMPKRLHPLFSKYTRAWLHEVTGYNLGYLCRVATGRTPLTRSFVDRVSSKLNEPEKQLFLPEAATEEVPGQTTPAAEEQPAGIRGKA